jgi:hypothetical protein
MFGPTSRKKVEPKGDTDKMIRIRELKDQIGAPYPRPLLICHSCGSEFSANRGDYFAANLETVLTCCGKPLSLAVKKVVYREVALDPN